MHLSTPATFTEAHGDFGREAYEQLFVLYCSYVHAPFLIQKMNKVAKEKLFVLRLLTQSLH